MGMHLRRRFSACEGISKSSVVANVISNVKVSAVRSYLREKFSGRHCSQRLNSTRSYAPRSTKNKLHGTTAACACFLRRSQRICAYTIEEAAHRSEASNSTPMIMPVMTITVQTCRETMECIANLAPIEDSGVIGCIFDEYSCANHAH